MSVARIIERTRVYDGWYKLFVIVMEMPDGTRVERHLLDNGSAVAVLPYDPTRRVCMLIKQPRAAVIAAGEEPLLEVIAGNLDGATPEARIVQEAYEEGGLRLSGIEPVANIWPLCPISTERVALFLAPYFASDRIGPGGGADDEDENITVHELSLETLRELTLAGALTDAKTLVLAQALLIRHPELWQQS